MSRSAPPATSLNPRLPKKSATPSFITAFALPRAHTAERTVRPFGEQRQHHEGHDREPDRVHAPMRRIMVPLTAWRNPPYRQVRGA